MAVKHVARGIGNLAVTMIAAILLIFLGIVFFMITVFTIKMGSSWAGYSDVPGSTVVLTAGIVSAAAIIGSAIQR